MFCFLLFVVFFFYSEDQCITSHDKAVPLLVGRDIFLFLFFNKRGMIWMADLTLCVSISPVACSTINLRLEEK